MENTQMEEMAPKYIELSKKIQSELRAVIQEFTTGQITEDALAEKLQHRKFTKSELWVYVMLDAKRKRERKMGHPECGPYPEIGENS